MAAKSPVCPQINSAFRVSAAPFGVPAHAAAIEVHRMLGFVGQMRCSIFHSGNFGVRIDRSRPLFVGQFLALAPRIHTDEIISRRCPTLPGHGGKRLAINLAIFPAHDGPQSRIGLHGRAIPADPLAFSRQIGTASPVSLTKTPIVASDSVISKKEGRFSTNHVARFCFLSCDHAGPLLECALCRWLRRRFRRDRPFPPAR